MGASVSEMGCLMGVSISELSCLEGIVFTRQMAQQVQDQPSASQRVLVRRSDAKHKTYCGAGPSRARIARTPTSSSGSLEDLHMARRRPTRAQTSPPVVNQDDLPMLEAQANKLRATIKRRTACAGASNKSDDLSAIVGHYVKILEEIEEQIAQLKGSPTAEVVQQASSVEVSPYRQTSAAKGSEEKKTAKKKVSFEVQEALLGRPASDSVSTACSSSSSQA
jgi:hypothetical protein